jgi:hypothetical protein
MSSEKSLTANGIARDYSRVFKDTLGSVGVGIVGKGRVPSDRVGTWSRGRLDSNVSIKTCCAGEGRPGRPGKADSPCLARNWLCRSRYLAWSPVASDEVALEAAAAAVEEAAGAAPLAVASPPAAEAA